jgi:hypothetical protein
VVDIVDGVPIGPAPGQPVPLHAGADKPNCTRNP